MVNTILMNAILWATLATISLPVELNKDLAGIDQEIRRLNEQEVHALLRSDTRTLTSIWSKDLVVTNPLNKFVNKQEVIDMVTSGTLAFSSYDRQIEYVHSYDETVVVAGSETVVWAGKMPNKGKLSHLRFTAVWTRQSGRWQEVARHANIVLQE